VSSLPLAKMDVIGDSKTKADQDLKMWKNLVRKIFQKVAKISTRSKWNYWKQLSLLQNIAMTTVWFSC